ncbi:site-specific integrase [Tropicimonas marinistellae]|uniref:site-specific integrase n=1 Tax=Tropicimonas marinistellae TaxID=1739787 RepID=UPI00082C112B|nr:site-specific integrase [Tropicimonas marinistellae]
MTRARNSLPYADWPDTDRAAWEDLFVEGDLLDGQGPAVHWSVATRKTNRMHYGRWLGWLERTNQLDPSATPAERISPERAKAFARDLMSEVSARTVASSVIGLKCVLRRMDPDHDWQWLKDLTNRLDVWADERTPEPAVYPSAGELFRLAVLELGRLTSQVEATRRGNIHYRDTLIVALLIACPIRARNLHMIRLGTHLVYAGTDRVLSFEPEETKTRQALKLLVPETLHEPLEHYIHRVRPHIRHEPSADYLWLTTTGNQLSRHSLYLRVQKRSEQLFGVPLTPHCFRKIAATFLSESSVSDALHARPLLGHSQTTTTERHYIRASQLEASGKIGRLLQGISRDGRT